MLSFLKYYKLLFKFTLYIDSFESEAMRDEDIDRIASLINKNYTTQRNLEFKSKPYIEGRGLPLIIPEGTHFSLKAHESKKTRAIIEIIGTNQTYITVTGEELSFLKVVEGKTQEKTETTLQTIGKKIKNLVN